MKCFTHVCVCVCVCGLSVIECKRVVVVEATGSAWILGGQLKDLEWPTKLKVDHAKTSNCDLAVNSGSNK